jgi:hypothetical protein
MIAIQSAMRTIIPRGLGLLSSPAQAGASSYAATTCYSRMIHSGTTDSSDAPAVATNIKIDFTVALPVTPFHFPPKDYSCTQIKDYIKVAVTMSTLLPGGLPLKKTELNHGEESDVGNHGNEECKVSQTGDWKKAEPTEHGNLKTDNVTIGLGSLEQEGSLSLKMKSSRCTHKKQLKQGSKKTVTTETDLLLRHSKEVTKHITGHDGPLWPSHPNHKGSLFNVMMLREDGTCTTEPLNKMAKDHPEICATYAKKNGLIETRGWMSLRRIANNEQKL